MSISRLIARWGYTREERERDMGPRGDGRRNPPPPRVNVPEDDSDRSPSRSPSRSRYRSRRSRSQQLWSDIIVAAIVGVTVASTRRTSQSSGIEVLVVVAVVVVAAVVAAAVVVVVIVEIVATEVITIDVNEVLHQLRLKKDRL